MLQISLCKIVWSTKRGITIYFLEISMHILQCKYLGVIISDNNSDVDLKRQIRKSPLCKHVDKKVCEVVCWCDILFI